jgi:hypothetical protein
MLDLLAGDVTIVGASGAEGLPGFAGDDTLLGGRR